MGWTYNTIDPDAATLGPRITGVAVALTVLSLLAVCLRLYVRIRLIKATGYDDWITVVTWLMAAAFSVISIIQTKWGLGLKNRQDLPDQNLLTFGLLQYVGAPFYILGILGFKLALLVSYLRILPLGNYQNGTKIAIMACGLFHLCFLVIQINFCQPIAKQWDPTIRGGSCLPAVPVYTTLAALTIVFDVIVLVLPFPALLESHIQDRKKFVLLGLFGLGIFITITQLVRIQTIKRLTDITDSAELILWSTVEINLGVIIATIPTLAPIVKYFNDENDVGQGGSVISGRKAKKTKPNKRHSRKGSFPLDSGKFDRDSSSSERTTSASHISRTSGSFEMDRNIHVHSKDLILGPMIVLPGPATAGKSGSSSSPHHHTNGTGNASPPAKGVITMRMEVVVTYD
ncbi:integral membrane protein [Rhypophila sp. PSN 637]